MDKAKEIFCAITGVLGGVFSNLFGTWSPTTTTLIIAITIDYITGITLAAIFKKSPKTTNGALESKAGYKGLCRKAMILFYVIIAYRLDLALGSNYIKNTIIIGFIINEIISITENAALMGIPMPNVLAKALEILNKSKGDDYIEEIK